MGHWWHFPNTFNSSVMFCKKLSKRGWGANGMKDSQRTRRHERSHASMANRVGTAPKLKVVRVDQRIMQPHIIYYIFRTRTETRMARKFHYGAAMLAGLMLLLVAPVIRASERSLSPFDIVHLCVPFNVQIQPGNDYSLNIEGDGVLDSAITADVTDRVLSLGTNAFSTSNPIKVTVSLPAGELKGVTQSGLQASAFVASGTFV